jgi:branched-chain amino acid transport system substrate-binding protein
MEHHFKPAGPTILLNGMADRAVVQEANKDVVSATLKKADFIWLRGSFKLKTNGYPIEDFHPTKVAERADGKFQTEIVQKVFENYGNRYASTSTGN